MELWPSLARSQLGLRTKGTVNCKWLVLLFITLVFACHVEVESSSEYTGMHYALDKNETLQSVKDKPAIVEPDDKVGPSDLKSTPDVHLRMEEQKQILGDIPSDSSDSQDGVGETKLDSPKEEKQEGKSESNTVTKTDKDDLLPDQHIPNQVHENATLLANKIEAVLEPAVIPLDLKSTPEGDLGTQEQHLNLSDEDGSSVSSDSQSESNTVTETDKVDQVPDQHKPEQVHENPTLPSNKDEANLKPGVRPSDLKSTPERDLGTQEQHPNLGDGSGPTLSSDSQSESNLVIETGKDDQVPDQHIPEQVHGNATLPSNEYETVLKPEVKSSDLKSTPEENLGTQNQHPNLGIGPSVSSDSHNESNTDTETGKGDQVPDQHILDQVDENATLPSNKSEAILEPAVKHVDLKSTPEENLGGQEQHPNLGDGLSASSDSQSESNAVMETDKTDQVPNERVGEHILDHVQENSTLSWEKDKSAVLEPETSRSELKSIPEEELGTQEQRPNLSDVTSFSFDSPDILAERKTDYSDEEHEGEHEKDKTESGSIPVTRAVKDGHVPHEQTYDHKESSNFFTEVSPSDLKSPTPPKEHLQTQEQNLNPNEDTVTVEEQNPNMGGIPSVNSDSQDSLAERKVDYSDEGEDDEEEEEEKYKNESEPTTVTEMDKDDQVPYEHVHEHINNQVNKESSHFFGIVKYLSYSLLFFLPEHLQDSILDVNDALILTGIIALALVSVCVPYFFIETYMAVRPLKKKVVELNRNLWKVSTAYENQQEDYEAYKKKALAYDEDKDRIEKLETELHLVKKLDGKHQDMIKKLKKELRSSEKISTEVESLVQATISDRDKTQEELEKMKGYLFSIQNKYKTTNEALESSKADISHSARNIDLLSHSNNLLELKVKALEKDVMDYKAKLLAEGGKRKSYEDTADKYLSERDSLQKELTDLKLILHQYEETVNSLSQEINLKENELTTLKESLGDDSPLVEAAELSAKLKASEESATALQLRVDSLTLENGSLSQKLGQIKKSAKTLKTEKGQAENKLQVLESYFKEKEEELRTMVEKYESEKLTRGMDKEGLITMIEEKEDEIRELNRRIIAMKQELDDTKSSHRNELRTLEAKEHENWLLLCQSERKLQESRKEAELHRQKLTALARDKNDDGGGSDGLDGDMKMNYFPLIPSDLIPMPLPDDVGPTYIGLGNNFMPPPPLDDDDDLDSPSRDREPLRPPPLGRLSPTYSDNDEPLSPIGQRGYDYSSGSSSPHPRPPSRESWINGNGNNRGSDNHNHDNRRHRGQPKTSSPINHAVNV